MGDDQGSGGASREGGGESTDGGIRAPDLSATQDPREQRAAEARAKAQAQVSFPLEVTHVSGRRYAAHVIDGILYLVVGIAIVAAALLVSNLAGAIALFVLLFPGQIAYYVLTERPSGRSPGKAMLGIRIVDAEGRVPGTGALLRRTIPLIVEYFYVIAWIGMMSSPARQRWGDRWAGTYVIDDDALPSPTPETA